MKAFAHAPAAVLVAVLVGWLAGCDARRSEADRAPGASAATDEASSSRPASRMPDALMVRFRERRGEGFSRESWEIEVLQMGGEVRVSGSLRTGSTIVPIYKPMTSPEYSEFWHWLAAYPLDRHQVRIDESASEADWRKTFEVDVVLGPRERWLTKNTWSHPLAPGEFVREIENRLHDMVLDLAETEVERLEATGGEVPAPAPATSEGIQKALDALDDAEPSNLPGGGAELE
jgi:hypothetical protein